MSSWLGQVSRLFNFGYRMSVDQINIDYKQPDSPNAIADLLPYRSFDDGSNIFINHNSYGFLLETVPFSGADESTSKILSGLINQGFPDQACIQVMCWASPKVNRQIQHWQQLRSGAGNLFQQLAEKRQGLLAGGAHQSLLNTSSYLIRDFRCFIAISLPGRPSELEIKKITSIQRTLLATLKTMQGFAKVLQPAEFIDLLAEWVSPTLHNSDDRTNWNLYDPLHLQIAPPGSCLSITPDGLYFDRDEVFVSAYTANKFPEYWAQWQMNDLIGDNYNDHLRIPCPFLSVLTVLLNDQDKARAKAAMKFSRATKQTVEGASRFIPIVEKQAKDWRMANQALSSGEKLVSVHYQVLLFSQQGNQESSESSLFALYDAKGWRLKKEKYVQMQSWLAALPFIPSEGLTTDMLRMGRFKTLLSSTTANLSPLQGEWKGMSTPRVLLTGRRGQPLFWDPFDNSEGNYNVSIVGKSGSGKSVFLQEICVALLGSGSRVFVIDKGRSFMRLAHFLSGTFLEFKRDSKLCLNPFTFIDVTKPRSFQESLKLLKPLIQIMAKPSQGTTDWENAMLEKAIHAVWQSHKNQATITLIAKWLNQHADSRAKDLGQSLFPYTASGSYGQFFEGDCNVNLNSNFVVLELEELQGLADLQSVVMLVLMFQVTQAMYLGGRQKSIACVIDEAWDLLGNSEQAAQFIEKGYRQARKYASSFMTGTQGINDYHKTPAALAAFENSDWMVLLSQKAESIESLKQSGRLAMTAGMEKMLKSLHTQQDAYSECMLYGPQGYAVGRLFLDEFSLALYTSKGQDFARIQYWQEQGYSIEQAIELFIEEKKASNHV